jgi:hypothetical protein
MCQQRRNAPRQKSQAISFATNKANLIEMLTYCRVRA